MQTTNLVNLKLDALKALLANTMKARARMPNCPIVYFDLYIAALLLMISAANDDNAVICI